MKSGAANEQTAPMASATVDGLMRLIINDATYGEIRDYAERLAASAAVQAVPTGWAFGLELSAEELQTLIDMQGGEDLAPIVLRIGDGHSGHGLYAWFAEYPDNGSVFIGHEKATPVTGKETAGPDSADPVQRPSDNLPSGSQA